MGEINSNPVLQVLDGLDTISKEVKYPEGLLQFKGGDWQAFYHCHSNTSDIQHLFDNEHGHFHIFVKVAEDKDEWSHAVALSMNNMGQPLRWFMVNHWVTAGVWLEASLLSKKLDEIAYSKQDTLLTKWLLSMLTIYKNELSGMLNKRDQAIGSANQASFLQDKQHYLLAEQSIYLEQKLQSIVKI